MTKNELIAHLQATACANLGKLQGSVSKKDTEIWLDSLAQVIGDALANGQPEVILPGIGKLKPVQRPARTGRNPATGQPVKIPARTAIKFMPAKALTDQL